MRWLWILTFILCCLLLLMGWFAYPLPGTDSACFIPPAINLKNGFGLTNPADIHTQLTDLAGQSRFMYYPPLFQLVLSVLMVHGNATFALFTIAVIGSVALLLNGFLLTLPLKEHSGLGMKICIALSLLGLCTYLLGGTAGRPEVLSMVFITMNAYILLASQSRYKSLLSGCLLGFTAATHPVASLFSAVMIGLYFLILEPLKKFWKPLLICYGMAIPMLFSLLMLSPYPLSEHWAAMKRHAEQVVVPGFMQDCSLMVSMFIANPNATFYGLLFLVAFAILGIFIFWKPQFERVKCLLIGIGYCGLLILTWYLCIRVPFRNYNLLEFVPLAFLTVLYAYGKVDEFVTGRGKIIFKAGIMILLVLTSIGFLRHMVLFGFYLHNGLILSKARLVYSQYEKTFTGKVIVSTSLWTLSEHYGDMQVWHPGEPIPNQSQILILQQNQQKSIRPPVLPYFKLIYNNFNATVPRIFGCVIGNSMPGYSFAIYRRSNKSEIPD